LIPIFIVSRPSASDEADDLSFDSWRRTVLRTAGVVTAVVGTGFGIGFSLERGVPATLIAAVLAAGIVARSGLVPRNLEGRIYPVACRC
jgi:hypothetical protein